MREAIKCISEYVQCPISMAAQCVIGAISHIAQRNVNAPHPYVKDGEPCSLFLLSEGQSGSRKSSAKTIADHSIKEYERLQYDRYRRNDRQWQKKFLGNEKKEHKSCLAETKEPKDPSSVKF